MSVSNSTAKLPLFLAVACVLAFFTIIGQGSQPACAQTEDNARHQKGNVFYRVPAGWKEVTKDNSTLLVPADVSNERKCVIFLLPGQEFSGDLKSAFEKLLDNVAGNGEKILQAAELQSVSLAAAPGVTAYQKMLVVEDKDGNKTIRAFVAAHPGKKRIEIAVIVVNSRDALKQYEDGIKTFLASWTFANLPVNGSSTHSKPVVNNARNSAKPLSRAVQPRHATSHSIEPKARPGELTGLFFGQHLENSFNGFSGTTQMQLVRTWYYFLPGGRLYYGLPTEGIASFDWQQHLNKDPGNCGTYHLEGDRIVISWRGIPKPWRKAFSHNGHSIMIDNETLEEMVTPVGAHFSGTYGLTTYTAVSGGGVGGDHKLVLKSDGQFEETGFVGFTVSGSEADATGRTSNGGSGSYRITPHGLELTYNDGRKRRTPFQVQASQVNQTTPEFIVLNGVLWLKR